MGLTFIDFFAGVGGFRRGMEMAGHKCLGHCEIDKWANESYKAIHNIKEDEWFESDIRRTRADDIPRANCWCFGFPCQDISIAGKQLGFRGHRSSLFFTVTRLIRDTKEENRPKYLFIENVKTYLVLMEDSTSSNLSLKWMKSGTMWNGKFSIPKITESHRTEKECSLLDILEEEVPEKYFLSKETQKRLLMKK